VPPRSAGSRLGALALIFGLLAPVACGPSRGDLEAAVEAYVQAVQELDAPRLMEVSAVPMAMEGALPDAPAGDRLTLLERRLEQRFHDYEAQRAAGYFLFAPDGFLLIRGLGLGRGAYYETVSVERTGKGRALLISEVRLAYRSINLSRLPRGTTIYLMGLPMGKIYSPVIGAGDPAARQLLERVWLGWDMVREDGNWKVAGVSPAAREPESYADTTRF
jgi:hypothetical protein